MWGQTAQMLRMMPLRLILVTSGARQPRYSKNKPRTPKRLRIWASADPTQNETLKPTSGGGERDSPLTDVKGTVGITTPPPVRNATRL